MWIPSLDPRDIKGSFKIEKEIVMGWGWVLGELLHRREVGYILTN